MGHAAEVRKRLAEFKGVLREPIRPQLSNPDVSPEEQHEQLVHHAAEQIQERAAALFAHYGLAPLAE